MKIGPSAETVPLVERLGDFMPVRGNAVELLDDYDGAIAALSGVQVQLILSDTNNQPLVRMAQQSYYEELLAAGVGIALYTPHFLHAKHLSVDDSIALVSSIYLDIRSFALNAEVGLLCYDRDVVARMHAIEAHYLAHSRTITLEQWRQRPSWRFNLEGLARLADSFM